MARYPLSAGNSGVCSLRRADSTAAGPLAWQRVPVGNPAQQRGNREPSDLYRDARTRAGGAPRPDEAGRWLPSLETWRIYEVFAQTGLQGN